MEKAVLLLFLCSCSITAFAQQSGASTNGLAVSQGVSSPVTTNTLLFSNGFTQENPVSLSYQNGYRLTTAIDGSNSTSFGVDAGVGDGQYGIGIGAYSNSCSGCESFIRGALSAIWGEFGLGFGVQDGLYDMGLLYNPYGLHRIGLVLESESLNGSDNNGIAYGRSALGVGYSYVLPQFTFSMDVAKQSYQSINRADDAILISPGIAIRVDIFAVSLSYDLYMNDGTNAFNNQVWVGVSANIGSELQLTFYGEYVDRWTIMGTYLF